MFTATPLPGTNSTDSEQLIVRICAPDYPHANGRVSYKGFPRRCLSGPETIMVVRELSPVKGELLIAIEDEHPDARMWALKMLSALNQHYSDGLTIAERFVIPLGLREALKSMPGNQPGGPCNLN